MHIFSTNTGRTIATADCVNQAWDELFKQSIPVPALVVHRPDGPPNFAHSTEAQMAELALVSADATNAALYIGHDYSLAELNHDFLNPVTAETSISSIALKNNQIVAILPSNKLEYVIPRQNKLFINKSYT